MKKFCVLFVLLLPLLAHAQLIPQVVQKCKKRNVFIEADDGIPGAREASGINVGRNRILSAYHVVEGMKNIRVDGKPARVLREWREKDLVLLQAETSGELPEVEVLDAMPKSEVFLVGNPRSCRNKVLYGSMVGVQQSPIVFDRAYKGVVWLADMLALPGASGGAVWDKDGRLVGVLKGWEKSGDISVIVPAYDVRKFLDNSQPAVTLTSNGAGRPLALAP